MTLLQTAEAAGFFDAMMQQGIAFGLMALIVYVLARRIIKLEKESEEKSKAHGVTMSLKDKKIEEITEKRRLEAIEIMTFVRDTQEKQVELINTINKLL